MPAVYNSCLVSYFTRLPQKAGKKHLIYRDQVRSLYSLEVLLGNIRCAQRTRPQGSHAHYDALRTAVQYLALGPITSPWSHSCVPELNHCSYT